SNHVDLNTATLTCDRSRDRSAYVDFVPVETETRDHVPLRIPSAEQQALLTRYDVEDVIPFVDIGNRYVVVGSGFTLTVLQGRSWQDITRALDDPTDPITVGIVGHANHLTAAICRLTDGQPAPICTSAGVSSAAN